MSKKDEVIERYMRDTGHKANSLYEAGYREGYKKGYEDGYMKQFNETFYDKEPFGIGEEVIDENGLRAVVTNNDSHIHLLYGNGKTWKVPHNMEHTLTKVGHREFYDWKDWSGKPFGER